jgi:hypothetical protein
MSRRAQRQAVPAAIARRDWLLQMLALGAAAGCRRGEDPAYTRGSTVVMAVPDVEDVKPDNWDLDFLTFLPLAKQNARGELEGHLARSWEQETPSFRGTSCRGWTRRSSGSGTSGSAASGTGRSASSATSPRR